MEQTLGKRISAHRKRLGLTQDQLAEKLGVSPQAVSKWENDQSCPDIAALPTLAGIFGISVDELLGQERHTVHTAEVFDGDAPETDGIHVQNGTWEFTYDNSRRGGLMFASLVLLVGGLMLAAALLDWDAGFWDISLPGALLVFGVFGLYPRFSIFRFSCTLFGGYFLLSNLGVLKLDLSGKLVLPVILLLFGLSLLLDALKKSKKPKYHYQYNGSKDGSKPKRDQFTTGNETFRMNASFCESTRRVTLARMSHGEVSCSFGDYTVDLSGVEEITDGCTLAADCSFGQLNIQVPRRYLVSPNSSTAFASLDIKGQPAPVTDGTIQLSGSVSFGEICVIYI